MIEQTADMPLALKPALEYLARGWSVLPLCPAHHVAVGKAHRGCSSPGKRPFFPDRPDGTQGEWKEFQTRLPTELEVTTWFERNPWLNVGVALGPVSGIVGIDIDDEDGEELLLGFSGGNDPQTWTYSTGKGRRLLYRLPTGVEVKSIQYKRPGTEIEILRLMSAGGQVVLPPSIHPNGSQYRWTPGKSPDDISVADVPEWWVSRKVEEKHTSVPHDGELIDEGGRDNYLTSVAGAMRKRGCHEEAIYVALMQMNVDRCNPPLPEQQIRKIARSVARYAPDEYTAVTIKQPGTVPLPAVIAPGDRRFKWASELAAPAIADEWLWNGYLPKGGIVLLSALWKAGKTTLLSHLLKALADDGQFLGRAVKASKVLYVSEEGEQHWVRRRDTLSLGDHCGFYLQPFKAKPAFDDWGRFVTQLAEDVAQYQFDLVVFDTLAKLWPVREENDAGSVDDALMPLWHLTKAGAGVLLIHHLRKSGGAEYTGSRGSGALSAFPDIVMELTRFDATDAKSRKRALRAKGRYDETPDEMVIELVDGEYRALSLPDSTAAASPTNGTTLTVMGDSEEAKIVRALESSHEVWVQIEFLREILRARGCGIRNKDLNTHLFSLYERRQVLMTGEVRSKTDPRKYALSSRATPRGEVGNEISERDDLGADDVPDISFPRDP